MDYERLFSKIDQDPNNGCWNWTGTTQSNGYGNVSGGKAHRYSYALFVGHIPPKTDVCHRCDNRRCVNPSHLFLGSRRENMRDCVAKGRIATGERHGNCKLSSAQVAQIRAEYRGRGDGKLLAQKFGVGRAAISSIVRGKARTRG